MNKFAQIAWFLHTFSPYDADVQKDNTVQETGKTLSVQSSQDALSHTQIISGASLEAASSLKPG